ncbi:antibiotic biosynthesis monooxygenase family protein [Streptomyces sp. NPDC000618]|uniref:antibiotic biosynthesis monooxygenase family protein n=1 Tax=Streptomyces sp. NPDC000618 TaxID=3154265 RepID=UPI003320A295
MIDLRDLDPSAPFLTQLQGPDDGRPITFVNVFLAPAGEVDKVIDVWREDALLMKAQPGFISGQLYRGIGDSRILTNVAVWENLTSLKDAFMREAFQNTLTLYPDGSLSHPLIVRKAAVAGVCVA